jgi:purine-nucleoside phosphorylase
VRTAEPLALPGPGDHFPEEAAAVVREHTDVVPSWAILLGSGLAPAVAGFDVEAELPFDALPGFPPPSVPGHPGRLAVGNLAGGPVAAFIGRIHYYEGHSLSVCTLPVRVARVLGAHTVVLTAAAGALSAELASGDVVVASDHLNAMGANALRGWRRADGSPPFVDLSAVYDSDLAALAVSEAAALGVMVTPGVYAAVPGPTYETPAEVEALRRAGATVVGMSVVPEAVAAAALGMRVLGLFVVTNAVGGETLDHQDVLLRASEAADGLGRLLTRMAPVLGQVRGREGHEDGSGDGL